MARLPESGRPCTARRLDGSPCRHKAINGLEEQVCSVHAGLTGLRKQARYRHGFYAQGGLEHFAYLWRVRPVDFVRDGGLGIGQGAFLAVRERDMDLHPIDPAMADINVAIAGLVQKMAILDALIFRADEEGLNILTLLGLYLRACSRLGRLVVERHRASRQEENDLLVLLARANAQLEGEL